MTTRKPMLIDADTHVVESPEAWISAVPASRRHLVPHVRRTDDGLDRWFIGEKAIAPIGIFGLAGTDYAYGDGFPASIDELPEASWNAARRLAMMDELGVHAHVIYPNVLGFGLYVLSKLDDRELAIDCVRIYNEWLTSWARPSGGRLVPIALLPVWDLSGTLREAERAAAEGHRGILFPVHPHEFGLPGIHSRHWDPLWHLCQEARLSVNFHIGFGSSMEETLAKSPAGYAEEVGPRSAAVALAGTTFGENISGLANLVMSGVLQRYPRLNFVSVESGIGYIPYMLEMLDWQFAGSRAWKERPEFTDPPSAYFRRQVYTMYWFEQLGPRRLLDAVGADRVMMETDFPHPTSLAHTAGLQGRPVAEYIAAATDFLAPEDRDRIMWQNAAQLYQVPLPA